MAQSHGSETPSSEFSSYRGASDSAFDETPVKLDVEDVAVVGMACRVAGGLDSTDKLWEALLDKRDTSGKMPGFRFEPYYRRHRSNPKELDRMTQRGYFVNNVEDFDCTFFGISPKEAIQMDPQQRLSVEVAWEALENAGIPPQNLSGSNTAVFMGVNSDDYGKLVLEDLPGVEAWMGIGTAYCGIPNRISYLLNLMGPSTAVDAACASSLVAIHHGRQSILTRESDVALVGGVNVLCGPGLTKVLDLAGAVSPEGRCKSFDDSASGYGRGEGAAVIVLKRMSHALRDNDRILAVLKGSAVGQDGRTNGIMAPNSVAQQMVARKALEAAGIQPTEVQFVEAHATSTSVGDPVEVDAISRVYGLDRTLESRCYIGSIKPNIGHLEAGAGAMGFIKTVLALKNRVLPPQANLKKLNSRIKWETSGLQVLQETTPWPETDIPRAAVCSYGYGGTVSHAVLEASQQLPDPVYSGYESSGQQVFVLSAPQEWRLQESARALSDWLRTSPAGLKRSLESIAATLSARRQHHVHRLAIIADSHDGVAGLLDKFVTKREDPNIVTGRVGAASGKNGAVWSFSGHGAQWPTQGQELFKFDPVFRDVVQSLDPIIVANAGFSARELLQAGTLGSSDQVQVLTYVMQVAMAATLRAKGLVPSAVVGHSVGEIAACVTAGCLSEAEGALIVSRRAALYRQVMGRGGMALVSLSPDKVIEEAKNYGVHIAIYSSPSSTVVAGQPEAVENFTKSCEERNIKTFRVNSDIPFHSPLLKGLGPQLLEKLKGSLNPRMATIPLYSTTFKNPREIGARDESYWVDNMIQPVRLTSAIAAANADGFSNFIEISTHPIISHSITEILMACDVGDFSVLPTLKRNEPTRQAIQRCVASAWARGVDIRWSAVYRNTNWATDVPTTIWKHQPFWQQVHVGQENAALTHDVDKHILLGQKQTIGATQDLLYSTILDSTSKPFPGSHPLHGTEIVPAAVLFNTFHQAIGAHSISDVMLLVPVAVSAPRDVQVLVQQDRLSILSRLRRTDASQTIRTDGWLTHTTGRVLSYEATKPPPTLNIVEIKKRIGTEMKPSFTVDYLADVGVSAMGFPWTVREHFGNSKEMLALVDALPEGEDIAPWDEDSWAPILDSATSIGSTIFFETPRLRMPAQVSEFRIYEGARPPRKAYIYVQDASENPSNKPASHISVANESGHVLAEFRAMRFSEIEGSPGANSSVESLAHRMAWVPATLSEEALPLSLVSFVAEPSSSLAERFEKQVRETGLEAQTLSVEAAISEMTNAAAKTSAFVFVPPEVNGMGNISTSVSSVSRQLLELVRAGTKIEKPARIFVTTRSALRGETPTALAHATLVGLGRIIASEQPDLWGGLIDLESNLFPWQALKYVRGSDIIQIDDGVAKVMRLRPLPREIRSSIEIWPKPGYTYLITGGFGFLGLEVASFLVEKGARRLVLVSRRQLPPRGSWGEASGDNRRIVQKIRELEEAGVSIHVIALDLSAPSASAQLRERLESLSIPPVKGVVHAAGLLRDQLVHETTPEAFDAVLGPKVAGALALNSAFPPGTLDFFTLFSSCGQLFGFPGQAAYAAGNAFLDALARNRHASGEAGAVAFQWTSWTGLGMAASELIDLELDARGITSITPDEAFRAWEYIAQHDIDHGVVLRSRTFDFDEPLPTPILREIVIRRDAPGRGNSSLGASSVTNALGVSKDGEELDDYLALRISECVASTLHIGSAEQVDHHAALPDMGLDSVMTTTLRRQLQHTLKVKVPPTLIWGNPTVAHLVKWFSQKIISNETL